MFVGDHITFAWERTSAVQRRENTNKKKAQDEARALRFIIL